MAWLAISIGSVGGAFCLACPARADAFLRAALAWIRRRLSPPPATHDLPELRLLAELLSSLRAGQSLDSALAAAVDRLPPRDPSRARWLATLEGRPPRSFVLTYVSQALASGAPALDGLQFLQRGLGAELRARQKAKAATAQARAQAEVLSYLPWGLGVCLFTLHPDWLRNSATQPLAWVAWGTALALTGAGRAWVARSLRRALAPASPREWVEEEVLPELVLSLLAGLWLGHDLESAHEQALSRLDPPSVRLQLRAEVSGRSAQLHSLLAHASRTGSPVREELRNFLEDLRHERETRWEERAQRLPVQLLAPLFLCFFPGTLLVLAGALLPFLREAF